MSNRQLVIEIRRKTKTGYINLRVIYIDILGGEEITKRGYQERKTRK